MNGDRDERGSRTRPSGQVLSDLSPTLDERPGPDSTTLSVRAGKRHS